MLKHVVTVTLISIISLSWCVASGEEGESPEPQPGFEFVVELSSAGVKCSGHHGVEWQSVSWSGPAEGLSVFWVTPEGVYGENPGVSEEGFSVFVEATASDAVIRSLSGTKWAEVSYGCGGAESCIFILNESGVRGL